MNNPLIPQGNLNRVLTSVVVPLFPQLTVTASYMAKSQAQITFEGDAVTQIPTTTGVVNSPAPFVQAQIVLNILRSQFGASNYYLQMAANAVLGTVIIYSDSTALGPFTLANASIVNVPDPGAFDGMDPTVKVTFKGTYYINSSLWLGA